jgi:hypothetical protein
MSSTIPTEVREYNKAMSELNGVDNREYQTSIFFKSPEGLKEYEKIGMRYPRVMQDDWYEKFLKLTKNTKKEDYKQYISNMKRLILTSGEEYIIHDMSETRYDGLHNRKTFYRGNLGMYPIPVPHREIRARVSEEDGFVQDIIQTIQSIDTGYSIPFNKKNIDKLLPLTDGKTAFSIEKQDYKSGMTFTIDNIEDWKHGNPQELLRFGHRASDYEKQILEDEKQGKYTHMGIPPAGGSGLYK